MKKIFGFAAVVAMVAAVNVRISSNNNEGLTALQLENIEYLAEAENTTNRCQYNAVINECYSGATGPVCPSWTCN